MKQQPYQITRIQTPLTRRKQITRNRWILLLLLTSTYLVGSSQAAGFYLDPLTGDINNSGTFGQPWSTLQEVFDNNKIESQMYKNKPVQDTTPLIAKNPGAPIQAGDTLFLRNGYHGDILAIEYYNEDYITIMAQPGHQPQIAHLELRSGCKWRVYGLTISPSFTSPYEKKNLIAFSSHSWTGPSRDCLVEACTTFSIIDASSWTKEEWDTLPCNGMSLPGNKMVARNNLLKNINFGINVTGDSCLVEYNTIENFAGDGIRGLGDYGTYQYNRIKNSYDVNVNHDDGFQSWSIGDDGKVGTGTVYGVVIRGNTIINYENSNQPFRGTLQGIGCFDGMFENWLVENNLVITDHWHGITLSGAINCKIINNTVVDINTTDPGPPWIRIGDHKNGTPSKNCIVRNNLATSFNSANQGVSEDHNIKIDNYDDFFIDYAKNDLHLKAGCTAIDSGTADQAPGIDKDGVIRPQGKGIDIGAYEYKSIGIISDFKQYTNKGIQVIPYCNGIQIISSDRVTRITSAIIYSVTGQVIKGFTDYDDPKVIWDGIDNQGMQVSKGCFIIHVKTNSFNLKDKFIIY